MLTAPISRDLDGARAAYSSGNPEASRSAHDRRRPSAPSREASLANAGDPLLPSSNSGGSSGVVRPAGALVAGADDAPGANRFGSDAFGGGAPSTSGENHRAFTEWYKSPFIKHVFMGSLDGSALMWISFAICAGARMSPALTLACAFALLVGGALNAGISDFLLARAECDFATAERRREQWELDNYEEGEIQEMIELYVSKGFSEHEASTVIHTMAKHPEFFVNHMMVEELGIMPPNATVIPWRGGLARALGFLVVGFLITAPALALRSTTDDGTAALSVAFVAASSAAAVSAFSIGALQAHLSNVEGAIELVRAGMLPLARAAVPAATAYLLVKQIVAGLN